MGDRDRGGAVTCKCGNRDAWRVTIREGNYSAFHGYRRAWSEYSEVMCEPEEGGCGARWRTKAKYVRTLTDSTRWGEAAMQKRSTGERGHQGPTTVHLPSVPESRRPRLVCEACGESGGPLRGPVTSQHFARHGRSVVYHRDLPECFDGIVAGQFAVT